jgi:hypothetical protein
MRVLMALVLGLAPAWADTFLLKSVDGGRRWLDIDPGPPYHRLVLFQPAGSKPVAVVAGYPETDQKHFFLVSEDSGNTWQERLRLPYPVSGMAVDPGHPGTIYLSRAGTTPGILKVTDAGRGLEECEANGLPPQTRLGGATRSGLYAIEDLESQTDCGIFHNCPLTPQPLWRSTDGGRQWKLVTESAPAGRLLVVPSSSETLYILSAPGVFPWEFPPGRLYKSVDGGLTWSQKLDEVGEVAIDPSDPAVIFAVRTRQFA